MTTFIVTIIVTAVAAAIEAVLRYYRFRDIMTWSTQPALVGAVVWTLALALFQWTRLSLDTPAIMINSMAGGIVWFVVAVGLGQILWQGAGGSRKRKRTRR